MVEVITKTQNTERTFEILQGSLWCSKPTAKVVDSGHGAGVDQRIFAGQILDADTNLTYMNARYYEGNRGQFLSQDPSFLAIGDPVKFKALTGQDMIDQLSDPQQLNSYSYARNNPLRYNDPTGNINWDTLWHPSQYPSVLGQAGIWYGASLGFNVTGHPLTGALMQHSLTVGPRDVNINQQNQKSWGNAITQIQNSSDFTNALNGYLSTDGKNGSINQTYDALQGSVVFNSGDLKTGVHGTYSTAVQGTQNQDGTWNLNVAITDRYDYTYQNYNGGEGGKTLTGANNAANFSQNQGVISNYGVTFSISMPNYNPNKKK